MDDREFVTQDGDRIGVGEYCSQYGVYYLDVEKDGRYAGEHTANNAFAKLTKGELFALYTRIGKVLNGSGFLL